MQIRPYLNFANTHKALDLYKKMGAEKIEVILGSDDMFRDMPEEFQTEPDFVMNSSFELFGCRIYASDTWGNEEVDQTGTNITFDFDVNNADEVAQVHQFMDLTVELGGEITMPLSKVEWTPLFGMVRDPLGVTWMFNGNDS